MTDWRKVRVEFDDADGNRVSAVMWQNAVQYGAEHFWLSTEDDDDRLVSIAPTPHLTVTPIRELPTGLGAVIEVTTVPGDCERWVRTAEDNWVSDWRTEKPDSYFDGLNFTVLSEGVPFD